MLSGKSATPTIAEYFSGKVIFLTGGTGFLGKVLIEKLLRSCSDLDTIYILIREKKGKSGAERIKKDITDLPLFDLLKKEKSEKILDKIKPIYGDVMNLKLGISEEDRKLLISKVNIVIHGAASVRFDDPLNKSILMNTRGTREICALTLEMKKLEVFMHVSTTYCQTDKLVIEEKLYPPHADWKKSIEIAEKGNADIINILTQKYTGVLPNTYTFAKHLGEQVVNDMCCGKVPTIVLRPSIVISTWKEPMPGWIDNFNGPVAMFVGSGKGILRVALGRKDLNCDFMPVDVLIKGMIMAIWDKGIKKKQEEKMELVVYNASQNQHETISLGGVIEIGKSVVDEWPLSNMVWYPTGFLTSNKTFYWLSFMIFHLIPAIFIDLILRVVGHKPMLVKIQRKVYSANMALQYFILNGWTFLNDQAANLENKLLPQDFEAWNFDKYNIIPSEYFKNANIGGKIYLLKENMDDLEKDKKHCFRMKILHYVVSYGALLGLIYMVFIKFNIISKICAWFVRYYENLPT